MGTGIVLETLNGAAAQRLPILFVCENNLYQDMTRSDEVYPSTDVARIAEGFLIPTVEVDGNDAEAVYGAVAPAAALVREGGGPVFVEAKTYLGLFHSQVGPTPPEDYRPAAEAAAWRERDPLLLLRRELERRSVPAEAFSDAESRARGVVEDAVAFARASPQPEAGAAEGR
jgi:TPP-dependent pyruvate/acetoin dehydrogenase alpha subunit